MSLEDRYGKSRGHRLDKIIGFSLAGAMIVGGLVFLLTGGMPTGQKAIEFRDVAHVIEQNDEVELTYEVTTAANREMLCALEALSPSYATVGLKMVQIPASEKRTRLFTDQVVTAYQATAVTVRHCWFPEV